MFRMENAGIRCIVAAISVSWLGRRTTRLLCLIAIVPCLCSVQLSPLLGQNATGVGGGDVSGPRIEVSERAQVVLADIQKQVSDGNYEAAMRLLEQLREIGPEVVLPQDGRGVLVALREMFAAAPEGTRRLWANSVEIQAREALVRAGRQEGEQGWIDVVRWYPATEAAREAALHLTAIAFEQGRFRRTMELAQMALADPDLVGRRRTHALLLLGLAAAELGDGAVCGGAMDKLRRGGVAGVQFLGRSVDPAALLAEAISRGSQGQGLWTDVGGDARRAGRSAMPVALEGLMTLGVDSEPGGMAWPTDQTPSRRQLLGVRRPVLGPWLAEQPVLVTARSLIAVEDDSLVAYDRLGGNLLWRALAGSEHSRTRRSWPSVDGEALAMMTAGPVVDDQYERQVLLLGAPPRVPDEQLRLVVLSVGNGRMLWSWDGSLAEREPAAGRPGRHGDASDRVGLEPVGSPLAYGGRVFVGAVSRQYENKLVDCFLMCFDLDDGHLLWQRFLGSGAIALCGASGTTADRMVPTTDGRRVYIESAVGTLTAVDLATSDLVWTRRLVAANVGTNPLGVAAANWEGAIIDAPIVTADGRLLIVDVYGDKSQPVLRSLDARTGQDQWRAGPIDPCRRMVAGDMLLAVSRHALTAYSLADGRELFTAAMPLETQVSGRGFATSEAAYLPTTAGIVAVDLKSGKAAVVHAIEEGESAPASLTPLSGGLVSNHGSGLKLLGRLEDYVDRVSRGMAEHPGDPAWTRRLAELRRQEKRFDEAEQLLRRALAEADALADASRGRDEKLATLDRMGRLQLAWARSLLAEGKTDDAIRRLRGILDGTMDGAAAARITMMLAELYQRQGNRLEAAAHYARVAGSGVADQILVPTDHHGLEQSLGSQALTALEALREGERPAVRRGLTRDELDRLEVRRVGMLTWGGPSLTQVDAGHATAPVLWSRTDGLIALGPAGEIRWRQDRMGYVTASYDVPVIAGGMFYECSRDNVLARRLSDGRAAWAWRVPAGRVTSEWAKENRLLPVRRVEGVVIINGRRLRVLDPVERAEADTAIVAVGKTVATVSYLAGGNTPVLHGLDAASGQERWQWPLAKDGSVVHLVPGDGVFLVATQRRQGMLVIHCVDAVRGECRWSASISPQGHSESLFVGQGVAVHMDAAGRSWVIDAMSGDTLWKSERATSQWLEARPVYADRDVTVFSFTGGHVVCSNSTGAVLWQHGTAPAVRESVFIAGAAQMGSWNREAVIGSLLVTWEAAGEGGVIVARRLRNGEVVWQHCPDEPSVAGFNFVSCGGMLLYHDVGDVAFRRIGEDDIGRERSLHFLDPQSGKYLGSVNLGAGSSRDGMHPQIEVYPVAGGLFVLNGDEMLTVRPTVAGRH
jgi:outer membrane protein assembly factor BamB